MGSGSIVVLIHSLDARSGEGVVISTPQPLYPWERTSTYCTGGYVGVEAVLDRNGKSHHCWSSNQDRPALASCYADYAIPAATQNY